MPRAESVALWVRFLRGPSPAHSSPTSLHPGRLPADCPHGRRMPTRQLLPQSLAPHLLQLARPSFLRPQGSEAGEDTSNVGTVETRSAYLRAPVGRARENKGGVEPRQEGKGAEGGQGGKEKDGPSWPERKWRQRSHLDEHRERAGRGQVRVMGRRPARKGGQRPLGNGSQGFLRTLLLP